MEENEYKIFDFSYDDNNNNKFKIKSCDYEHKYLITKSNYEFGIKYLNNKVNRFDYGKLYYFCNYNDIINCKYKKDFVLVTEKFLKALNCDENVYNGKYIDYFELEGKHFLYFCDNKILAISDINNEIKCEIVNEKEKEKNEIKDEEGNKMDIIKSLILLYANEKEIEILLNISILDEYEFKDYYLINKDFIEEYKKAHEYVKVSEFLKKENYNYNYNEYYSNLNKIINTLKSTKINTKQKLYKDEKFYPIINEVEWSNKNEKINCLDKFIIVPENLFDLLYKSITPNKYTKENYKYRTLIGDQIVFIQNNNNNSKKYGFSAYRFMQDTSKFKLFYYFLFDEDLTFYQEVNNYIKGKGLFNYVEERNLDINVKKKVYGILANDGQTIGHYKNIRKISDDEINEFKHGKILSKLKKIVLEHNNFTQNIENLEENDIDLSDINNISESIDNKQISYIKTGIILQKDLINLEKKLFFKEINDLIKNEEQKDYKKEEMAIIKKLSKLNEKDLKDISSKLIIYKPDLLNASKNKNNNYNFINNDIRNLIDETNNNNDYEDCYYFKSKDQDFIYFTKKEILYTIIYNEKDDSFKLDEYKKDINDSTDENENKDETKIYDKIKNYIKDLENNDKDIKDKLQSKFEEFTSMKEYYLISSEWIQELKKHFKNKHKNTKIKLSDYLFKNDNLRPNNLHEKLEYKKEIPIDFDIISKNTFESIIEKLNSLKKNSELKSDYLFNVSFACDLILIKELDINEIYIYSIEGEKYKLEYIITLEKDRSLKDLFKDCKDFDGFLNKYDLNLSKNEAQKIIIEEKKSKRKKEKKKIGEFICVNPKEENQIEEDKEKEEEKQEKLKEKQKQKQKKPKKRSKNSDIIPEELVPVHCLGLENIGATCYMNATIQCLCNVLKLKNFFQNNSLVNSVTMGKNCPLTLEFSSLINHLWKLPKDNNNLSYYNPTDFKNTISKMDTLFQGIAANDSKDLILFIYENIHREIHTISYNNNQYNLYNCNNDFELLNFRNSYYASNNSIIADTFYFEQQNCLRCTLCNYTKISYNIANILIFPLEKVRQYVYQTSNGTCNSVSLEQCFMQYQIGEYLRGENQIYCNQCRNMADAIMVNNINTSPEVLTIILNRGKGLEFDVDFHFEHYINIDNYVLDKTNNKSNFYELICILCHYGPSGMSGHFIAFCKSPEDKIWYCYNDASVTKCEGDPDISKYGNVEGIPYVLYYQRYGENNNNNNNVQNGSDNSFKEQMKNYTLQNQNNNNNNEDIKSNNNKDEIHLNFTYEDNMCELDIQKNKTIGALIKQLKKELNIPKNKDIMVCSQKQNNMNTLIYDWKINECDLNDNDTLIVIDI